MESRLVDEIMEDKITEAILYRMGENPTADKLAHSFPNVGYGVISILNYLERRQLITTKKISTERDGTTREETVYTTTWEGENVMKEIEKKKQQTPLEHWCKK